MATTKLQSLQWKVEKEKQDPTDQFLLKQPNRLQVAHCNRTASQLETLKRLESLDKSTTQFVPFLMEDPFRPIPIAIAFSHKFSLSIYLVKEKIPIFVCLFFLPHSRHDHPGNRAYLSSKHCTRFCQAAMKPGYYPVDTIQWMVFNKKSLECRLAMCPGQSRSCCSLQRFNLQRCNPNTHQQFVRECHFASTLWRVNIYRMMMCAIHQDIVLTETLGQLDSNLLCFRLSAHSLLVLKHCFFLSVTHLSVTLFDIAYRTSIRSIVCRFLGKLPIRSNTT